MLETKRVPTIRKAIAIIEPIEIRKDDLTTEHPDLRMIRRHRAAEAAIRNLERIRDIESNRSSFIR
ncbi:MAG: hypothetical protein ACFFER_15010 [Candidatus Thorarchaeota archaeon]